MLYVLEVLSISSDSLYLTFLFSLVTLPVEYYVFLQSFYVLVLVTCSNNLLLRNFCSF